jgi:hypothetical protein
MKCTYLQTLSTATSASSICHSLELTNSHSNQTMSCTEHRELLRVVFEKDVPSATLTRDSFYDRTSYDRLPSVLRDLGQEQHTVFGLGRTNDPRLLEAGIDSILVTHDTDNASRRLHLGKDSVTFVLRKDVRFWEGSNNSDPAQRLADILSGGGAESLAYFKDKLPPCSSASSGDLYLATFEDVSCKIGWSYGAEPPDGKLHLGHRIAREFHSRHGTDQKEQPLRARMQNHQLKIQFNDGPLGTIGGTEIRCWVRQPEDTTTTYELPESLGGDKIHGLHTVGSAITWYEAE